MKTKSRFFMGYGLWWFPLILLFLMGCQDSIRRDTGAGSQVHPVAVVNNEKISLEEFQNTYHLFLTRWDRFIQNSPTKKQEIKEILLANMIDIMLLDQEARRRGVDIDPGVVDAEIERLTSPWSESDLTQAARVANRPFAEWRQDFFRRMIHEKLIKKEVVSKIRVSQREMRAYYERNRQEFILPEKVKVRHIAVGSRSVYNRVVRQLKRNVDFVKLVRKYSTTPDREADGDLGYVERGVLPLEFDKTIFNMTRIGSVSPTNKPVKNQMGYHLFKLEGRKPRTKLSFEAAKPSIKKILIEKKQQYAFKKWLEKLREKSSIKIDQRLLKAEMG